MIRINEIFGPTIQGEGPVIGVQTIFIRTWGCDSRCAWCDTKHAWGDKTGPECLEMSVKQIVDRVKALSEGCKTVTLTGGNPCTQNLTSLVLALKDEGYDIVLETQGTIYKEWVSECNMVVVSPKPPSAGDVHYQVDATKTLGKFLALPCSFLKVVVFDDMDFRYAKVMHQNNPDIRMYLQPGNSMESSSLEDMRGNLLDKLDWLIDQVMSSPEMNDIVVLPQLHTLIWGNERGR